MMKKKRFWQIGIVLLMLLLWGAPEARVTAFSSPLSSRFSPTGSDTLDHAQDLLEQMTVAERVGQLFLVAFRDDSAPPASDVADLITNYHVGGVVLRADNNNITGHGDLDNVPQQVANLNNQLQRLAISGPTTAVTTTLDTTLEPGTVPPSPTPPPPHVPIPLLVATHHEGDGHPNTQIWHGITSVPNNMAIGATWQPPYARQVGQIVGRELSALGINMLLGPSLDVLEKPATGNPSNLATRVFGGDPYWVGQMGQAYTSGVHLGSNGRMAVIAKHFPGNGGSDRLINQEVPTVRKSLEQLKQIELAPFLAVTGRAPRPEAMVDGLLVTHIRYQGFQGNIRATTAPVSFDPQAFTTLMQLPEFAQWRQNGGLMVSDVLGARAVERFYDDTQNEFPHRRVAKDAFLAGNDMLYLADFAQEGAAYETQIANVKDTIRWFEEKYRTDPAFQQRVDTAVLHILQLKLRLYDEDFSLDNVLVENNAVNTVGQNEAAMFDLAQAAITLISPSQGELVERMASPPGAADNIVIFTDVREVQQCNSCPVEPLISRTALEEQLLHLYGPNASGQVQPSQISSFTFADLADFLAGGPRPIVSPSEPITNTLPPEDTNLSTEETPEPTLTPTPSPASLVQERLADADWIIFAMLDKTPDAQALSDFLSQRTDILRDAKTIVFAYHAPYYLDTTEISKLTAYFGVYSTTDAFIDASVRALFQELPLAGAPPVDIESIGYNLFQQTQPDPEQVIELFIAGATGEPQSPPREKPLDMSVGETLRLQTGVIVDHNGNPVPDDTPVQFIQRDRIQGLVNIIAEAPTRNGIAQLDYVLEARTGPGQFRITAVSGEAEQSQEVDIFIEGEAQVAIISPTPAPTDTPTPSPTPTATPTATQMPTPTNTPEAPVAQATPAEPSLQILLSDFWMLLSLSSGLLATAGLGLLFSQRQDTPVAQQVTGVMWGLLGSLLLYNYFALGLPGMAVLLNLGSWAGLITTLTGGMMGLLIYRTQHRG